MKKRDGHCRGSVPGAGLGSNALAALITRGTRGNGALGSGAGARPETLSGLAGLGDLVLTCTGLAHRNRFVGIELGKDVPLSEIMANMRMVAEGVNTAAPLLALAAEHQMEMPSRNRLTPSCTRQVSEGCPTKRLRLSEARGHVRTRSPSPARPLSVSGLAPAPLPSAPFRESARDQRRESIRTKPQPLARSRGNGHHVLSSRRPAPRRGHHRWIETKVRSGQTLPAARGDPASREARTTAVGSPRAASAAQRWP